MEGTKPHRCDPEGRSGGESDGERKRRVGSRRWPFRPTGDFWWRYWILNTLGGL